jgi:hypothetical protein
LWVNPHEKNTVITLINSYFKTNDNPEQIIVEEPRQDGSAVAYCSRILAYMTRHVGVEAPSEDKKEAEAVSAWGSIWNIRRYSTSICKSTLWKLARNEGVKGTPEEIAKPARAGKYMEFLQACEKFEAKIHYEERQNSYQETYKVPVGIEHSRGTATKTVFWKREKVTVILKSQEATFGDPKIIELAELEVSQIIEIQYGLDPPAEKAKNFSQNSQ